MTLHRWAAARPTRQRENAAFLAGGRANQMTKFTYPISSPVHRPRRSAAIVRAVSCKLRDRLDVRQDRHRPAREITELVTSVNAEMMVNRRQQMLRRQGPFLGVFTTAIGGANHLTKA